MEKILSIEECSESNFSGFKISTDQQEIKLLIADYQCCCENWGYFMSQDEFSEFIGSELISLELVDELLNTTQQGDIPKYETSCMFVNIKTTNGMLQFVAYNSHNGYYGHSAKVISTQLSHQESL